MSTREVNEGNILTNTTLTHTLREPRGGESTGNGKSSVLLGAGPGQCRGVSSSTQLQIGRYPAAFGQRELQYNREFPAMHNT